MNKLEELDKMIFCNEILKNKLNQIKEAFIRYYGEDLRDEIEEKFRYSKIIFFRKPKEIENLLKDVEIIKSKETIKKYLNSESLFSEDDLILFFPLSDKKSNPPIRTFIKYYNALHNDEISSEELDNLTDNVKRILELINPNLTLSNEVLKEFERLSKVYPQIMEEYNESIKDYYEKIKIYEEYNERKERKLREYYCNIFTRFRHLFPNVVQKEIDDYLNSNDIELKGNLGKMVGSREVITFGNIFYFKYPKEDVKNKYYYKMKEYFEICGIDLNNKDKIEELWPNQEEIQEFYDYAKDLSHRIDEELFRSLHDNKKIKEELDSLELVDKDNGFDVSLTETPNSFTKSNAFFKDGEFRLFNNVFIRAIQKDNVEDLDHAIIHELNHMIETYLLKASEKGCITISGYDYINTINQDEEHSKNDFPYRKYELLNEVINELIALEIYKDMHGRGIFILDNPDKVKDNKEEDLTSYLNMKFVVEEFFETYKDAIIKSRRDGNIQIIFDEVGEDNFNALNRLINEKMVSKSNPDSFYVSDREKIEIAEERDRILKRMKEYKIANIKNREVHK